MGREIRAIADRHDVEIVHSLGADAMSEGAESRLAEVDVAFEFTRPEAAVANIESCIAAGCPIVVGSSGWYDRIDEVRVRVEQKGGALLWSENFSPGYALMRAVTGRLAALGAGLEGYDLHIVETHHTEKRDAPSGTADRLRLVAERASGQEVAVTSIRSGHVPGVHELLIDGPFDRVELRHDVRDRSVFADGALRAARWLVGRTGFFSIDDWVGEVGR